MKNLGSALLALTTLSIMACGEDGSDAANYPANLTDNSLLEAQPCSVETRCPDGLDCLVVDLVEGRAAVCADRSEVCASLDCGTGECVVLESYPAQVTCMDGEGEPGDGDGVATSTER